VLNGERGEVGVAREVARCAERREQLVAYFPSFIGLPRMPRLSERMRRNA
jgi:hypothetical protein